MVMKNCFEKIKSFKIQKESQIYILFTNSFTNSFIYLQIWKISQLI